jgi:outer membrane protein assembly factor BamB
MRRLMSRAAIPAVALLALLLGACGHSGVSVKVAAPLPPSTLIPYIASGEGTAPGGVTALNGRDGTMAWHAATGDSSGQWAPVVEDGVLYTEGGSFKPATQQIVNASLVALRLSDGHMLWQASMPEGDFGLAVDAPLLLVAAGASGLYALDASDGAVRWHRAVQLKGEVHAGGGIVVVTRTDYVAPNTYVASACLAAFRERDGAPLWCSPNWADAAVAVTPNAIVIDEGSSLVGALAPSTGKFLWEGGAQGSIVAVNHQHVLVSGVQQLAALDTATGHVAWQSTTPFTNWAGAAWSSPEAAVYGAYETEVVALRTGDGTELWRARYGDYMATQFVVEGGVLFVLLERQGSGSLVRLVAVAADSGAVYWQRDLPNNILFLAQPIPGS